MLCFLGWGKLVVLGCGVVLALIVGLLVNLFLRDNSLLAGIESTLPATTMPPVALSAAPMTLECRDIARLVGLSF
jgi:hypothetical protein